MSYTYLFPYMGRLLAFTEAEADWLAALYGAPLPYKPSDPPKSAGGAPVSVDHLEGLGLVQNVTVEMKIRRGEDLKAMDGYTLTTEGENFMRLVMMNTPDGGWRTSGDRRLRDFLGGSR